MTAQETREEPKAVIIESARLAWLPTTPARLARRAQLDREKKRQLRLIQDKDGPDGDGRNGQGTGS